MATEEFKNQFRLNQETIARFAGFYPEPTEEKEILAECKGCGYEVNAKETKLNAGFCNECFDAKIENINKELR